MTLITLRNVLGHGYFGIDDRTLWAVLETNVPALRQEWISRVILEAFLQRRTALHKADARPAGTWLEGNWQTRLPLKAAAPGPSKLAVEAMCRIDGTFGSRYTAPRIVLV